MKIYFEDGRLDNPPFCDYHVNAAEGVRANIFKLDAIKEKELDSVIYTNSIFAFDNTYAWDNELNRPEIYIRDSSGVNGLLQFWVAVAFLHIWVSSAVVLMVYGE